MLERRTAYLHEPALDGSADPAQQVAVLIISSNCKSQRSYIQCPAVLSLFPSAFGVRVQDRHMAPMIEAGDVLLGMAGLEAELGRPAICRTHDPRHVLCRIWLGRKDGSVHLGRLSDGQTERLSEQELAWAIQLLYRIAA